MDNHQYYQGFCTQVETIETYGNVGAIGITPTFLTNKIKEQAAAKLVQEASNPSDAEHLAAIKFCRDEFLGKLMLNGANKELFWVLKNNLSNQYGFGNDFFPKSPDQFLSLLNHHTDAAPARPTPASAPVKQNDEAAAFAQGANNKSTTTLKDEGSSKSSSSSSILK